MIWWNSPGVVLSSGRLSFSLELLRVSSIGTPFSFALNYLSGVGLSTLAGLGFNFTQGPVLTAATDGTVTIYSGENTQEMFTYSGSLPTDGTVTYSSTVNHTSAILVRSHIGTTNEKFTLTSRYSEVAIYSGVYASIPAPGRLLSVTDRNGNEQSFTWGQTGSVAQLLTATDSYGREVNFAYYGSEAGYLLKQIEDYQGRQVNFQYDDGGRLVAVVLPSINLAAEGNTYPNGTAYVFAYDTGNSRTERQNDLTGIWYPNQTQAFMGSGRTVDVSGVTATTPRYAIGYGQDPTDTDMWGRVVSVTAGAGSVGGTATYAYTSNSLYLPTNLIDSGDPIVFQAMVTDRNGNISYYNFNANQMPSMVQQMPTRNKLTISPSVETTINWVTWTKFNAQNQPLSIVYPEGNSVEYTYDSGSITGFSDIWVPRRGLLLTETHLPGNSHGISPTDHRVTPTGTQDTQETAYFYDPFYNRKCATVEPRGNPYIVSGSVYFTPQNGGSASAARYASYTTFDYQKNQTGTVTNYFAGALGITTTQAGDLLSYAAGQMTTAGITAFAVGLGDINGEGTGDGAGSGLPAATMLGNVVRVQRPTATLIGGSSPTQVRQQVYTSNEQGQLTTATDAEGNVTAYVRYPLSDPNGTGTVDFSTSAGSQQYGMLREIHIDVDPNDVMSLIGAAGDMVDFSNPRPITRSNTPGIYQDLVTRFEGSGQGGGCSSCAYDELGNPTAVTDARGFTRITERNEVGQVYRSIAPQPYGFTVEMYYDANGNLIRTDTQDWQVAYDSADPTSADYGHFTPTGSGYIAGNGDVGTGATGYAATAHVPMVAGPGGTVRPGWFTNLYSYNVLDWKTQDDVDATGSTPSNLITTYAYDPNGNLITVTKPEGNTIEYDYDERNLRIAQRVGGSGGAVTVWFHDNNGKLNCVVGPADRGTTSDTSLTAIIADAFMGASTLTHVGDWVLQNVYDGFDRVYQATDAVGNVTTNTYDPGGRMIQITMAGPIGGTTPTDRTGSTNTPLSTSITRFDEGGRAYEQQQNVFIATGTSLPSGRAVTHTGGGLQSNSASGGHTATVTLTSGGSSYVLAQTVYDRADRATVTLADNTGATTNAYDGASRAIAVTDPLGNTMSYAFDGMGNAVQATSAEAMVGGSVTETFTGVTFYDCLGRTTVMARQGADGSFTPSLTEAVNWSGNGWEALPATLFSFTGYDSRGNATLAVDPNGNSVITILDGASRAIEVDQLQRVNGQGNQPPPGNQSFLPGGRGLVRTQSVFDGNSRLATLIDSNGNETSYAYDLLDRQVTMTFQDGSARSNAYDLAGDVTTYVDENGSSFASTFDPLGRKTAVAITRATGVVGTTSQAFQYDGLSRMTECQDVNSDTSATAQNDFYFDSLGRVLEERAIAFGNTRYTTHSQFISTVLQQLTYPNDRQTTNTWDLLYRRTEVAESGGSSICQWSFFGPGRLAGFGLGNGLVCTYLNNDNTNSAVQSPSPQNPAWGDSTTDRLGYDGAGRNICKRYIDDDSNLIVGFTTAYDRAGNKAYERPLQAEERASLYLPFNATTNAPGSGYDSLNRLLQYHRGVLSSTGGIGNAGGGQVTTAITLPGTDASRTYNLDDLGNWKTTSYVPEGSSTTTTEVRRHNSTNELTKFGSTSVTYDHGNNAASTDTLVKQRGNGNIVNDGTRIFAYDALNRVTQVNSAASPTTVWAVYTYDALGRRIRKVVTNGGVVSNSALNGTTDYLYDDQQIIEDRDGSNAAIAQYAWGMYIDELIQKKVIGDDDYFLLSDMLYRAAALTDSDGNIVETYDTDAYGNTICYSAAGTGGDWWADDAATTTNPINTTIFTGRQYDAETGIYYYRARYYHPALGRFIGRDPIDFRSNIMLYLYCAGNPSLWVDFTGTDNSGKLTLPEGQQSIIDGEYMLMKACDRCPSTTGCSVQQCKAEVKRLISNLLKAWTDNYGKGPLKGRDPVAGWFCWDWEAAFKDAADNSALTCLSASDGKLAADPNSDGSIPVHYFLEVHVCKGTSNDTQVSFDDGFFDGQNISHEGTFPSPTPPTGYHPVPFVPSPKQIWHPPIRR